MSGDEYRKRKGTKKEATVKSSFYIPIMSHKTILLSLIIIVIAAAIFLVPKPSLLLSPTSNVVSSCTGQPQGTPCLLTVVESGQRVGDATSPPPATGVCNNGVCEPRTCTTSQDCAACTEKCEEGKCVPQAGIKKCSTPNGLAIACCSTSATCGHNDDAAWCVPTSCPPQGHPLLTNLCSNNGDGVCCLATENCSTWQGYSWCKTTAKSCEQRGEGQTCGSFHCCPKCSSPPQPGVACGKCTDYGGTWVTLKACDYTQCGSGKEVCKGITNELPLGICCNAGKCLPSTTGPPACSDGIYNP